MNFINIVTGLALGLMIITAYEAKKNQVRFLIIAMGVLTFVLPALWRAPAMDTFAFLARVVIALGCYLFLRSHRKIR